VPEFAEVYYYSRHPEMQQAKDNFDWIVKAAEAAAMGTQTRMEYELINGVFNVLPNETLAKVMYKNPNTVGGITYTEEEMAFASKCET
jgi:aminobenzoyl-glutamate utilization protein B